MNTIELKFKEYTESKNVTDKLKNELDNLLSQSNEYIIKDNSLIKTNKDRVGMYYRYYNITEWIGDGDYLYSTGDGVMVMSKEDSEKLIEAYNSYLEDIKNNKQEYEDTDNDEYDLYDRQDELREVICDTLNSTIYKKYIEYEVEQLAETLWDCDLNSFNFGENEFKLDVKLGDPSKDEFKIYSLGLGLYDESEEYFNSDDGCTR